MAWEGVAVSTVPDGGQTVGWRGCCYTEGTWRQGSSHAHAHGSSLLFLLLFFLKMSKASISEKALCGARLPPAMRRNRFFIGRLCTAVENSGRCWGTHLVSLPPASSHGLISSPRTHEGIRGDASSACFPIREVSRQITKRNVAARSPQTLLRACSPAGPQLQFRKLEHTTGHYYPARK